MRKYLQISIVLVVFGLMVILKNYREIDEAKEIKVSKIPTPTPTVTSSTPTPAQTNNQVVLTPTSAPVIRGQYKDGTYRGSVEDAFYGLVEVQASISSGKITDVIFLQYPNDRQTSVFINQQAMPYLKEEAIQAQNSQVDIISGATQTSLAFRRSLENALAQAK